LNKLYKLLVFAFVVLLSSCAPKYISYIGTKTYGYFDYQEIKNKYGIWVTSLNTFEGRKYNAIGESSISIEPSILNKDDYNKLPYDQKGRYENIKSKDDIPLYQEIIKYEDCLKIFLTDAKNKGADGVLEFSIKSVFKDYYILSKNSPHELQNGESFSCYGILVKFAE
jgi:hypothetical protein